MYSQKEKMLFLKQLITPVLNKLVFIQKYTCIYLYFSIAGTFITEWDEGKVRCHKVIESEESLKKAADKLVEITKYFQFDGWLINIENVVDVCCIFFWIINSF